MNIEPENKSAKTSGTSAFDGRLSVLVIKTLLLLFLTACRSSPPPPAIRIALANNKQVLQITGLDPAIMGDINRDDSTSWQILFPVYKLPADTDMKDFQPEQPGKYLLKDSILLFTPDTAFIPDQSYFMRYNRFGDSKTISAYITGKAQVKRTSYTDLIFKP